MKAARVLWGLVALSALFLLVGGWLAWRESREAESAWDQAMSHWEAERASLSKEGFELVFRRGKGRLWTSDGRFGHRESVLALVNSDGSDEDIGAITLEQDRSYFSSDLRVRLDVWESWGRDGEAEPDGLFDELRESFARVGVEVLLRHVGE